MSERKHPVGWVSTHHDAKRWVKTHPTGFTIVELMLGLMITALVMAALAGLTFGVSVHWQTAESAQSLAMIGTQAQARIEQIVRQARLTGVVRTGGSITNPSGPNACVMFWRDDANGDRAMQFSEMGLLEYDNTAQSILLYSVQWPAGWTPAAKSAADVIMSSSDLSSSTAPEDFKALANVQPGTLIKHVTGASFSVGGAASATERPRLDVVLRFQVDSLTRVRFFSAVLRCPNKSPSSTPVS